MTSFDPPPPHLTQRLAGLVDRIKRAIAEGSGRDRDRLGPLGVLLWNYLGRILLRFAALQARLAAGMPPSPARPSSRPGPRATSHTIAGARIPSGPVFARYGAGHLGAVLAQIVAEPEMQALLQRPPQAGRLLRPLWRKLSPDPMPQALRLPPRPKRARPPVADAAQPGTAAAGRQQPWRRVPWARPSMRIERPLIRIVGGRPFLPDW